MSTVSNILLDQEILLESGTNELELLVFDVAQFRFGINVAKVREVLPTPEITRLAKAHPSVRGVFRLREQVVPCVSLLDHLGVKATRAAEVSENTLILTDFNQQQTAFLVDDVERIHRISWKNILSVPSLEALSQTPVTGVARVDEQLEIMLDFEMVIDQVTDRYFRTDAVENPLGLPRETLRILLADDSPTVREAVGNTLRASGYTQLEIFQNGGEAWQWIEARFRETGRVEDVGHLMLSDIEMPQVDGFHLTKKIKEHPQLRQIPVLLYSSIATPDNYKKGAAVGADEQITKPELAKVVEIADRLISEGREKSLGPVDTAASTTTQAEQSSVPQEVADTPSSSAEDVHEQPPETPATSGQASGAPSEAEVVVSSDAPATSSPQATETQTAQTQATSATAEVDDEPATQYEAPSGVNRSLWTTFRRELTDRSSHLERLIDRLSTGDESDEAKNDVFRTLHTIKSASMVVPVDEVTRVTHLVESVLEAAREISHSWPFALLKKQALWLQELADPFVDPQATLSASSGLEIELAASLAGMAD